MKNKFLEESRKRKDKLQEKTNEIGKIAKKAREAFKNVTLGDAGSPESLFILGFVAGYKEKEKEV